MSHFCAMLLKLFYKHSVRVCCDRNIKVGKVRARATSSSSLLCRRVFYFIVQKLTFTWTLFTKRASKLSLKLVL